MRTALILSFGLALSLRPTTAATDAPPAISAEETWASYHERSREASQAQEKAMQDELSQAGLSEFWRPASGPEFVFNDKTEDAWYQSSEGRAATRNLTTYQSPAGGWSKGVEMRNRPRQPGEAFGPNPNYTATFDNGATVSQLRHLARAAHVTGDPEAKQAFRRGLRFILAAQYPNGGWPQIYPLVGKYHDCITYNDKAMVNVMVLLRDIERGERDFAWLDESDRSRAANALQLAIGCVLDSQVQISGKRLGWAQQHDPLTLQPAPARAYEMASLASAESAGLLDLLLTLESPDRETVAAIEAAAAWLKSARIEGFEYHKDEDGAATLRPAPGARPLWARFYEIGGKRALFGDRDGSIHYELEAISRERRKGYSWYVTSPASALNRYEKWRRQREQAN